MEKWILDEKSNNITVKIVFAVISSRFCRKIEKISLRSQYHLSPPIFQEILKTWISDEKSNNITVKNRFCRNIEPFCREIEKLSSSSNYHVSPRARTRARARERGALGGEGGMEEGGRGREMKNPFRCCAALVYIYTILLYLNAHILGGGPPPQKKSEIGLFLPDLEISRIVHLAWAFFSGAPSYIRQSYSRS